MNSYGFWASMIENPMNSYGFWPPSSKNLWIPLDFQQFSASRVRLVASAISRECRVHRCWEGTASNHRISHAALEPVFAYEFVCFLIAAAVWHSSFILFVQGFVGPLWKNRVPGLFYLSLTITLQVSIIKNRNCTGHSRLIALATNCAEKCSKP